MNIVGCGIVLEENKILLLKKSYGKYKNKYLFPGGKQHENETIEECIYREVLEEINCSCIIEDFLYYMEKDNFKIYFYKIKLLNKNIKLSEEHSDYIWINIKDINKIDLIEDDYELISFLKKKY